MNAIAETASAAIAVARLHYNPDSRELSVLVDTADGLPLTVAPCGILPTNVDVMEGRRIVEANLFDAGYAICRQDWPYAVITTPVFQVEPVD